MIGLFELATVVCLAGLSATQAEPEHSEEAAPKKIVVDVAQVTEFEPVDWPTLRRLIAWRSGDLYLAESGRCLATMKIARAVEGELREDDLTELADGAKVLRAYVVNDPAVALDRLLKAGGRGTWRFERMPDGSLAAHRLRDSPYAEDKVVVYRNAVASIKRRLNSLSAKTRCRASGEFVDTPFCFALLPDVLFLASDGTEVSALVGHVTFSDERGCVPMREDTTVGMVTRGDLERFFQRFKDGEKPGGKSSAAAWSRWWRSILATPLVREEVETPAEDTEESVVDRDDGPQREVQPAGPEQ